MRPSIVFVLMLAAMIVKTASAAGPGRVRIVQAAELTALLPKAAVLDARDRKAFEAGHVPGSQRMDWREYTEEAPGLLNLLTGHPERWGKAPSAGAELQERLRALGLSNERPTVVVGDPKGWGEEGRIAWNLLYWGAGDVALLDGGFPAWEAAGGAVERGSAPKPAAGDFTIHPRPERRSELGAVKNALERKTAPILDARTPEEYAGEKMKGQKRGGHLPGAPLVPYRSLYRSDGRFVDAAEVARLTGLPAISTAARPAPITYCTGGVRSALLAVLIEARLGVVASNYDGSMWEWSAHDELPLVATK